MIKIQEIPMDNIEPLTWHTLIEQSPEASFFQTYAWIKLWLEHFSLTIDKPLVLAIYEHDILIGIAPFAIKNHTIQFLSLTAIEEGHTLADYGDIIVKSGKENEAWLAILEYLNHQYKHLGYALILENLREQSTIYRFCCTRQDMQLESTEVAPWITLCTDWASYLATLSSHARHELKRKIRRSETHELVCNQVEINAHSLNDFCQLIQVANQQKQNFYSQALLEFFLALFKLNEVKLSAIYSQKKMIAALITLQDKNNILAYNTIFDLNYNHLSPGIVLFAFSIRQAIDAKMQHFDFLRGHEPYKYNLGAQNQNLFCAKGASS